MTDNTIIIGGGPGGSSAAIYLARFCHPVTLIDAGEAVAGRTGMATSLRNFLGNTIQTPGPEFLSRIKTQMDDYEIEQVEAKVEKVTKEDDGFTVTTDKGDIYQAKYLIVAVGVSDNMPEIEGLDPYYDSGIFHCLTCDWYDHRDQKAAVIANDDRGLTTALALDFMHRPPSLCVIPAKPNPKFTQAMQDKCAAKNIAVYTSPIKELKGAFGNLSAIVLEDGTEVETEVMFTKLGHVRLDQFLDEGNIKPDREPEEDFIKVDFKTFESSVENLFAIGPCNEGPDQAIIAAGEGALAASAIHSRILTDSGI
jgi:thioredoxin reductase (NADPH)